MRAVTTLAALLLSAGFAHAACFESLGRTGCTDAEVFPHADLRALSCENLWWVRNTIFHENGYCFKTAKGRASFDNTGCRTSDTSRLRLNEFERANIARIVEVERRKGCGR